MRKLHLLSLCLPAMIAFTSCTKEVTPRPVVTEEPSTAPEVNVDYSDWTTAASFTWKDTTIDAQPYLSANWNIPTVTLEMINNGHVLVFARTAEEDSEKAFPASLTENYNTVTRFQGDLQPTTIQLLQSTTVDGTFQAPRPSTAVQLRYIILQNMPPANGRIDTEEKPAGSGIPDTKGMSYQEIVNLFHIPR